MTLQVIASAQDRASQPLKQVDKAIKNTGKSIRSAVDDMTKFNQIMFTTSAFVGFFGKAMRNLSANVEEGARLDRLSDQYERVLGPTGTLFKQISEFTDASIDRMEAMRAGIAMGSLGIATSSRQVAELVARAGVAAKQAGKDSGEGVKAFTDFLKDSNISHLEQLNLIRSSDPAYKTYMAILGKVGGVMAGAMSAQERLSMGMTLLRRATQNNMKGFRDLLDTVQDVKQSFGFLTKEIGSTVGTALSPLLEKFIDISWQVRDTLRYLKQTDQGFLFLIKTILTGTAAFTGLIASMGTARLLIKGLGALGVGVPGLSFALGGLALAFGLVNSKVKVFDDNLKDSAIGRFGEKLKTFGAILRGVFELTSSFFEDENYVKGVGKISKSVKDLLEKHGLLSFTVNLAKAGILISKFAKDVYSNVKDVFDFLLNGFDKVSEKIANLFGKKTSLIPRSWLGEGNALYNIMTKLAAGGLLGLGGAALMGKGKGLISKIPIIGKFLGGGGKGPAGSKSDPIYTRSADVLGGSGGFLSNIGALISGRLGSLFKSISLAGMIKFPWLTKLFEPMKTLTGLFNNIIGPVKNATSVMDKLGRTYQLILQLEVILGAAAGVFQGITENWDTFSKGFSDIGSWFGSKMTNIGDWISMNILDPLSKFSPILKTVTDYLGTFGQMLYKLATSPFTFMKDAYKGIVDTGAAAVGMVGQSAYESSVSNRLQHFQRGTVDYDPGTSSDRQRFLQTAMTDLHNSGDQKNIDIANEIGRSMRAAIGLGSEGGGDITQSEFLKAMAGALKVGIDSSMLSQSAQETAQSNKKMANEPKMNTAMNRGGC